MPLLRIPLAHPFPPKKVLSSGTPEVCDYPFTTRSIKMGHFYVDARKHQVTDTPGLLARPDCERNAMELLTLAALSYLPSRCVRAHALC
jgi:nucleolar GTP-binding protein